MARKTQKALLKETLTAFKVQDRIITQRDERIAEQDREIAEFRAALTLTHDALFRLDKLISFKTVPLDLQDKLVHAVRAAIILLHEEEASDR